MATLPVGHLLLNSVLPASHQIKGEVNKKQLNELMVDFAHKDPKAYVQAIGDLKRIGDEVSTDLGVTVGLDDIEPDYARRDAILEPALANVKRLHDPEKRRDLIARTQQKILEATKRHPGQMTPMALSGARGNIAQQMRTVASPVATVDAQNTIVPWMISKSYAEGLKAPDAWVAMSEARRNAIETYTSVAAPGELSKILVNNMTDQLITMPDCGTKNGIMMTSDDPNILGRFRADTGQQITRFQSKSERTLRVRSPMTCEAPSGICQKCYGEGLKGQLPQLGENVGMHAAHAMGEPLTQMALDAKHATRTASNKKAVLDGISGFRQLTEIPQSFFNKATLASQTGKVTDVKPAPQGGHYVNVNDKQHYVPPQLAVLAKKGMTIEAGDVLSDGIPKPDEVVKYKGLGAGRDYLVNQLHGLYDRRGIGLDRRHLELLAKTDLNYIRIKETDKKAGVMRGDIVDYNRFRNAVAKNIEKRPLKESLGQVLGDNALHYTAGTHITPSVLKDFQKGGLKEIPIAARMPDHEPVMRPIARTPLLHPDWLAKMGHRHLKNVILEGAAFGDEANIHGTHPVPSFVFGQEFGEGPQGRY